MSGATDAAVESGIGLDYDNLIMQTTVFSEHDAEFVTFNNSTKRASISRVEHFLLSQFPLDTAERRPQSGARLYY